MKRLNPFYCVSFFFLTFGDFFNIFCFGLGGDHTRTRAMVTSRVGALAAFTKKRETCLGCKAVLPVSEGSAALCGHCKPNETQLYLAQLSKYRSLESTFSKLWTQCQTCQCSLHEEVICTR